MAWIIFVAGAVLAWGAYGALLFEGQVRLGNPLKALLCVGIAYFLIGVLVPLAGLTSQGALSGFTVGWGKLARTGTVVAKPRSGA